MKKQDLFQLGLFTLNSGLSSPWKIECDVLSGGDIDTLCALIRLLVGPYSGVVGVPKGGLPYARRLAANSLPDEAGKHPCLIVDDVLTTGASMETMRENLIKTMGWPVDRFVGVVVFARGPCPPWVKAVLQTPPELWLPRTPETN